MGVKVIGERPYVPLNLFGIIVGNTASPDRAHITKIGIDRQGLVDNLAVINILVAMLGAWR